MATETVAPPPIPTTDDEQIELKVSEEKKADEECGEKILKTDDSICLDTPAVEHEKIEPPVVEADKIVDAPVSSIPPLDETKVECDPIPDTLEQVVEAERNADAAVSAVPIVEEHKVECDPIPDIPEQVVDPVKIPEEVESSTESVVREAPKEGAKEIIDEEQVEQTKIEAIERTEEPLQANTDTESVEAVVTEIKESEPETLEVEEKPGEQCEVTQEVETKLEEVEIKKSVEDETVKDEEPATDTVEPIACVEEASSEKPHDEVEPEKCVEADTVKDVVSSDNKVEASTIPVEAQTDKDYEASQVESPEEEVLVNGNGADYSLPETTEAVASQDQKKEAGEVDVVEKIQEEEAAVENENVLEAKENEKEVVVSTEPIKEEEKAGLNGSEAAEKAAEEGSVKLVTVGEENVEAQEIEEKEKSYLVTEESTQPIKSDEKKEVSGLDGVEVLAEEAAVEVEHVGEKNVETEDEKKYANGADVIEKSTDETEVNLEENVVKTPETKEGEKKDVLNEDSSLADQTKESNGVDEAEKLAEDAIVESEEAGEVIETKNVQSEYSDGKTVLEEVLTAEVLTPSEATQKSYEVATKDDEPAAETEKQEHVKVETPGTVETKKEDYAQEKQDEVTALVTESLVESKPSEPEVKGDESVALEKTTEDVAESDRNVELQAKDSDDTKPSEDLSKEVPAKTSQKQSNTILSKVKHTLVKAKRVITGKSPSSKMPASETKEDVKVK